jgi:hypothetical protein
MVGEKNDNVNWRREKVLTKKKIGDPDQAL